MTSNEFNLNVADLTAALDRLAASNLEVKKDLQAETHARNEKIRKLAVQNRLIMGLIFGLVVLIGGLGYVSLQIKSATSGIRSTQQESRKNGDFIKSCVTPSGACYKNAARGQKVHDTSVQKQLNEFAVRLAQCGFDSKTDAEYNICINMLTKK